MKIKSLAILLVVAIFAFTGCKSKSDDETQTETIKYVKVETIKAAVVRNKMVFNGKIKENSLTSLSFRVGGPLLKLTVKTGDFVRAGQVIAAIDKRDYELQVQTTKAQFTQTEAEYNRYKQLAEQDKIPANTFERVQSGYLMAKTAYENAQNHLADTELKAPFSAYVFEKFVENHQTVGAGQAIVSVIDNSQLEAIVSVSESQLQRVRADKTSYLTISNAGVSNLPVKLLSVSKKALDDGLYEVKFSFRNTDDMKVAPGMTAEVTMFCQAQGNQMSVAGSALFRERDKTYVWIYNTANSEVEKREIKISLNGAQGRAIVMSGLNIGEQIVTAGVYYLLDGQEVKPIETPAATNIGGLL